jgi:hypothetical protein
VPLIAHARASLAEALVVAVGDRGTNAQASALGE